MTAESIRRKLLLEHLDERCSECGHRIGVHYAVSNAADAFGTWCSESGCDACGTDPDAEWRIGTQPPDRYPAPVWLVFQTDIILGIPVRSLISICDSEETARRHVEELRNRFGAGLHFQIVGPWPIRISDERRFAIDF